jgi:CBS domain-containing protein
VRTEGETVLMATHVRDIMETDVPTVTVADSVETVLRVLRDNELPGVPVVNEGGRCVGIITEEDLVLTDEDEDFHMPHYFQLFGGIVFLESVSHWEDRVRKAFAATAEDMMTADPVTIEPDATVREAARLIARKKHNRLPVVEHGRLVGVVTRVDVLDALTSNDDDE